MTQNHCIAKLLKIEDPHIKLEDQVETVRHKNRNEIHLIGTLTYRPTACQHCGATNHSSADIINHGFVKSKLLLGQLDFQAIRLVLKKQRFYCKHCQHTFTAQTDLVDAHSFISKRIKHMILFELSQTQSMSLIAQHFNVSVTTVIRILEESLEAEKSYRPHLPQHLAIDEFKSVKSAVGAMSCVLVNNHKHTLFDVLEDRTQKTLEAYFMRYSLQERRKVKTITIDMYSPYYKFFQELFPDAKMIIDRFHVIQLLNRTLNQIRVKVMNHLKTKRPRDYRKLKQEWKLILKNSETLDFTNYYAHRLYEGVMTEKMRVDYLIQLDPRLRQAYDWVNRMKFAVNHHHDSEIEYLLEESRKYIFSRPLRKSFNTIKRYLEGIKKACHYTLSNGYIEGVNNKIKLVKRTGYGYRRFDHLKARIILTQKLTSEGKPILRPLTFKEEKQQEKEKEEANIQSAA